jgi:hypothetical protein
VKLGTPFHSSSCLLLVSVSFTIVLGFLHDSFFNYFLLSPSLSFFLFSSSLSSLLRLPLLSYHVSKMPIKEFHLPKVLEGLELTMNEVAIVADGRV